jgi:hypothetical protein
MSTRRSPTLISAGTTAAARLGQVIDGEAKPDAFFPVHAVLLARSVRRRLCAGPTKLRRHHHDRPRDPPVSEEAAEDEEARNRHDRAAGKGRGEESAIYPVGRSQAEGHEPPVATVIAKAQPTPPARARPHRRGLAIWSACFPSRQRRSSQCVSSTSTPRMLRRWPNGCAPVLTSSDLMTMLIARLHPPIHEEGVKYTGLYNVEFGGEIVVVGSRNPECDLARVLLAKDITGKVTMLDANTGKPRTVIDIERAAKLAVEENRRFGPRFVKWKPYPEMPHRTSAERSPAAEDDLVLPTMPPEANEAA